jgi:hypothetical protein
MQGQELTPFFSQSIPAGGILTKAHKGQILPIIPAGTLRSENGIDRAWIAGF